MSGAALGRRLIQEKKDVAFAVGASIPATRSAWSFLGEDNLKCETLNAEEEARLLLAAPPYLKDLVTFAVNTGLRPMTGEQIQSVRGALEAAVKRGAQEDHIPTMKKKICSIMK
jgi:hypothetical protein